MAAVVVTLTAGDGATGAAAGADEHPARTAAATAKKIREGFIGPNVAHAELGVTARKGRADIPWYVCDCGASIPNPGRCDDCKRTRDKARGTRRQRGYDQAHDELRKAWAPRVQAGQATCWRCGQTIPPGAPWDLGHDDNDRRKHRGPEHASCNRATKGRQ